MSQFDNYITTKMVAELLNISARAVRFLIDNRKVIAKKTGHTWLIYKPSVLKLKQKREESHLRE
jgi:excisionase family DNA binding protein